MSTKPILTNKEIYQKTLGFSIRRLLWDVFAFIILIAATATGFLIAESTTNKGLIGLGIGAIFGLIIIFILLRYVAYSYKAGQIAMMTSAITTGALPADVIPAGKQAVKDRFTTVAAYFAVTSAIKAIFNQLGRGISAVGQAVGGDTGSAVGDTISSAIQTIVAYLCDCCLGWVFYRSNEKATKATCEGAVIFFKHGKTLLKNLGRIFGISLISFLVIGGIFFGISFGIMHLFPDAFAQLSSEIVEAAARANTNIPDFFSDPNSVIAAFSVAIGVIFWSIIHSTFVRPFILVGVLRNFINSGIADTPTEESFKALDQKSKKFAKLHSEL